MMYCANSSIWLISSSAGAIGNSTNLVHQAASTTASPGPSLVATIDAMYLPCTAPYAQMDRRKDEMAEKAIDKLSRYAANFRQSIIDKPIFTPLHYEAMFGCTGGDCTHG